MVRVDTRLLDGVVKSEKDYSAALVSLLSISDTSLSSISAYASSTTPPVSSAMLAVAVALAGADEALRKYIASVDAWREDLKQIRRLEEEVGNVLRDREILVTRLLKASKGKSARESLIVPAGLSPIQSADNLTIGSIKLSHAQAELQACEKHLASKERELDQVRRDAVRHGLQRRCQALAECGQMWGERGRDGLRGLESLVQASSSMQNGQNGHAHIHFLQKPLPQPSTGRSRASIDSHMSSITPSESASRINIPAPSSTLASTLPTLFDTTVPHSPYSLRRDGAADSRSTYTLDIPPAHAMSDHMPTIPPSHPSYELRRSSSDSDIVGPVEVHENKHIQEGLPRPKTTKRASTLLAVPTAGSSRLSSSRNPPVSGVRGSKISRSDIGPSTPPMQYDGSQADRKRTGSFSLLGSIAGFFNPSKKRSASTDARASGWSTRTDQNLASASRHSAGGRRSRSKKKGAVLGSSSSEDNIVTPSSVVVDRRDSAKYLLTSPVALRSAEEGTTLKVPKSPSDSPTTTHNKLSKRKSGGLSSNDERGRQSSVRVNGHVNGSDESGEKRKSSLKTSKVAKHASLHVTGSQPFDGRPHDRSGSEGGVAQSRPHSYVEPREKDKQSTTRSNKSAGTGGRGQSTLMSVMEVESQRNSAATLLLAEVPKAPGSVLPASEIVMTSPKSPVPSLPLLPPNPAFATGSNGTKAPVHGSTAQGPSAGQAHHRPTSAGLGSTKTTVAVIAPAPTSHAPILKMPQPKPAGPPITTHSITQPGSKPPTPVLPLRSALRSTRSPSPVVVQAQPLPIAKPLPSPTLNGPLPSDLANGHKQPSPTAPVPSAADKEIPSSQQTNGNGVPGARPRPPPLKPHSGNASKRRISVTSESESMYETGQEDLPSSNSDSETDEGVAATPTRESMAIHYPPAPPVPFMPAHSSPAPPPPAKLSPSDQTPRPSTSTQDTITTTTANSTHNQVGSISQSTSSTSTSGGANTTRRKSVRMELIPTIAPTPPAIEYESNDGHAQLWTHHPSTQSSSQGSHSHGHSHGKKTASGGGASATKGVNNVPSAWSTRIEVSRNAWDDSSEEDEAYGEARRALVKAQKRFDRVGEPPASNGSKFKNGKR